LTRLIGAYLCPGGVFGVECAFSAGGVRIDRSFAFPKRLGSINDLAQQFAQALDGIGARRARVSVAVRGFGSAHHVLSLPPASDRLLRPVVEREMRRLEPDLPTSAFGWITLPGDGNETPESKPQRQLSVGAVPLALVGALESAVTASGNTLQHVTVVAASIQCIKDEFFADNATAAIVAPLPDGAFIGFAVNGALRLIVEPPLDAAGDDAAEIGALAEELELGVVFLRQQFRGAEISRVALLARRDQYANAESVISARIGVPAARLAIAELDAPGATALGAVLDSRAARPLSVGGQSLTRQGDDAAQLLRLVATAALVLAFAVGAWSVFTAWQVRRTTAALVVARRQLDQESFGLVPASQTAAQRKLIQDARAAIREVDGDRVELQQAITRIASAAGSPIQLDSLLLDRDTDGWKARLEGRAAGMTNARAVQVLSDFYGALPRQLDVQDLTLETLAYADSANANATPQVVFSISFGIKTVGGR
jgi:hypothetical protein